MSKKLILITAAVLFTVNVWGQTPWQTGSDGKIFYNGGNVGIGTTNPLHKLEITGGDLYVSDPLKDGGTIRSYGHYMDFKGRTDNASAHRSYRFYPATGSTETWASLRLYLGNTNGTFSEKVKITSNGYSYFNGGNVGIGTDYPTSNLHIYSLSSPGNLYTGQLQLGGSKSIMNDIYMSIGTHKTHAYTFIQGAKAGIGGIPIILNGGGGNVGIGTTNPLHKLEITNGDLYVSDPVNDGGTIRSYGHYMDFKGRTDNAYAHRSYRFYPATGSTTTYTNLRLYEGNTDGTFVEKIKIHSTGYSYFNGGNVGIGTTNPTYKLSVKGTIGCGEIKVENVTGWSDFVFEPNYNLRTLKELETYIQQNNHLPEIPTTAEVEENGISLGEMDKLLLQKIEELTLYVIGLKKENEDLKDKVEVLMNK